MMAKALIKRFWKPLLAVLATCALGIAVMVGMSGGCLSLERSTEDYLRAYRYYDASITTELTADDMVGSLEAVAGVKHVDARMVANTVMIGPNERVLSIRAMTYAPDDWQRFVVWESAPTQGRDAVLVECEFARDNEIRAGDELRVRVDGSYRSCVVEALVSAPETLSVRALDDLSALNSDFGAVYVPVSLVAREPNPEHEQATAQLAQREAELADAQAQARQAYEQALEELQAAQDQLAGQLREVREALALLARAQAVLDTEEGVARDWIAGLTDEAPDLAQLRQLLQTARRKLAGAQATAEGLQEDLRQSQAAELIEPERLASMTQDLARLIARLGQADDALAELEAGLAQAQALVNLLENAQVQRVAGVLRQLDPDTGLSALADQAQALRAYWALCDRYGIAPSLSGTPHDVALALLASIDAVEADQRVLSDPASLELAQRIEAGDEAARESEAGQELARCIERYTGAAVTAESLQAAASNCQELYDLVVTHDLRAWAERLLTLTDTTSEDWLELLREVEACADALQDALGGGIGPIETVGQLLAAFDQLQAAALAALDQLQAGQADVADQLLQEALAALDLIQGAQAELGEYEAQARDGLASLDGLDAQLTAGRQSAESQWQQGLIDFSRLRDELDRARAELGTWKGYDAFHNQVLLWFDEGADQERTLAAARAALSPLEVKSSFSYEDSPVKTRLDNNVVPLRTLSYYLPALFFGIVLMVTFLFMSLMVRQSRVNIGIMRALGQSTGQVRAVFCSVGLLVSLGAIPLGLALGWAVVSYTAGYYADFFHLPAFERQFDGAMLAWAIALTVAVVQVATIVGTGLVARIQPSEALSRPVPPTTRIPRPVRTLTARLDELSKFGVLSLLRNPLRAGFSVLCIAASVAIIYASQAFIASKNYLVRQEFDQRLGYDCQLFLSQEPDEQTLAQIGALGYVRDLQRVGFYSCPIAHDGRSCDATVNAVAPDSDLIGIYDARGERIAVPTHGIVLDEHLAQELGVGVGDTVELRGARLRVEALSRQDSNRVQYVSLETMRDLGEGSIGCVICRVDPADQQRLMQALSERDDYVFAIFTDVLRSSTERLHATYDTSAWILTSFAVAIGALVVFNVTQANLLERKRELCVLRTLGFEHRQLSAALLWQTLLYAGLACVLGLPAGTLLALRALGLISTPDRSFPYANGPLELTVAVGIVLLYAVVSHFMAMRSMRRWDINEGVKDRE